MPTHMQTCQITSRAVRLCSSLLVKEFSCLADFHWTPLSATSLLSRTTPDRAPGPPLDPHSHARLTSFPHSTTPLSYSAPTLPALAHSFPATIHRRAQRFWELGWRKTVHEEQSTHRRAMDGGAGLPFTGRNSVKVRWLWLRVSSRPACGFGQKALVGWYGSSFD